MNITKKIFKDAKNENSYSIELFKDKDTNFLVYRNSHGETIKVAGPSGIASIENLVATLEAGVISIDTINEKTTNNGVKIENVILKDGGVSNSTGTMLVPMIPTAAIQELSGAGAVNVTSYYTAFTSTATGNALTLADGTTKGQLKKVKYIAQAAGTDTGIITPTNLTGYTSITLDTLAGYVTLQWDGANWNIIEYVDVTLA